MENNTQNTDLSRNDGNTMLSELLTLKGKDKIIVKFLFETYGNMDDNDMMLNISFVIFKRLHPIIKHLTSKEQKDIIHQSIMIAYESRISGFEHMIERQNFR